MSLDSRVESPKVESACVHEICPKIQPTCRPEFEWATLSLPVQRIHGHSTRIDQLFWLLGPNDLHAPTKSQRHATGPNKIIIINVNVNSNGTRRKLRRPKMIIRLAWLVALSALFVGHCHILRRELGLICSVLLSGLGCLCLLLNPRVRVNLLA